MSTSFLSIATAYAQGAGAAQPQPRQWLMAGQSSAITRIATKIASSARATMMPIADRSAGPSAGSCVRQSRKCR